MAKDIEKLMLQPRHYPNFVKGYLDYTKNLEAPTDFHVWTAISIIAGALQGKCFIDMGHFRWKPNCFIVFVAPPGIVAKSTTSGVGTDILRRVPNVNMGPSSCTWQALLSAFDEVTQTYRIGNKKEKQSCLTIEASELGTFINFKDPEMVDVIVDLWDGKDKPVVRKTVGGGTTEIASPWINLVACTTPSWIQQNMNSYSIGGGFTSRCIFVYAERKAQLIAYPSQRMQSHREVIKKNLVEDLTRIAQLSGEFVLDEEAIKFGTEWYEDHYHNQPKHLKSDQLAGYSARKQTHMHKIAMCLSAAESNDKVIKKKHLQTALSLLAVCEQNMSKVFSVITDDRDASNLQILKQIMLQHKDGLTRRELFCSLSSRMSEDSFRKAFDAGVNAGYFENVVRADGNLLRPSAQLFKERNFTASKEDLELAEQLKQA